MLFRSEKALQVAPSNLYLWSNKGVTQFRAVKFKNAEESFRKAIAIAPEDSFSWCTLGIVEIVKEGYPDSTAFDRKHDHHDPESDPENPRWYMVDVKLERRLSRVITLEELRKHAKNKLKDMVLLRPGNRLSITPVDEAHWKFILALE